MTITTLLPVATVCLLGAMSPGPSLAMIIRHTLGGGRVNGLTAAWSHAVGIGVYALMTVMGLAVLMHQFPMIFNAVAAAGGCYLIWIGKLSFSAKSSIATKLEAGESSSVMLALRDGLVISLLSPKIMLFFIALFSPMVAINSGVEQRGALVATPLLIDGLWYSLVVLTLSQPAVLSWMRDKAVWIDKMAGLALMVLGGWVILHLVFGGF